MARSMIRYSGLQKKFGVMVLETVAYILNLISYKLAPSKSTEPWTRRKPSL